VQPATCCCFSACPAPSLPHFAPGLWLLAGRSPRRSAPAPASSLLTLPPVPSCLAGSRGQQAAQGLLPGRRALSVKRQHLLSPQASCWARWAGGEQRRTPQETARLDVGGSFCTCARTKSCASAMLLRRSLMPLIVAQRHNVDPPSRALLLLKHRCSWHRRGPFQSSVSSFTSKSRKNCCRRRCLAQQGSTDCSTTSRRGAQRYPAC